MSVTLVSSTTCDVVRFTFHWRCHNEPNLGINSYIHSVSLLAKEKIGKEAPQFIRLRQCRAVQATSPTIIVLIKQFHNLTII